MDKNITITHEKKPYRQRHKKERKVRLRRERKKGRE